MTLGQRLELPCTADGAPQPKITWRKEIGVYSLFIVYLAKSYKKSIVKLCLM